MRHAGTYPLAEVIALREREAALAGAALSGAVAAEERARSGRERLAALASLHAARLARGQTALESFLAVCEAEAVQTHARHLARLQAEAATLAKAVGAADEEVAAAAAQVAARAAAFAEARGAVRGLERHRERWRAARVSARGRRAEEEADALVNARRSAR